MDISVIIITRDRLKELRRAIDSILDASNVYPGKDSVEIIIADNNDNDYTYLTLKHDYPNIKILRMGGNLGVTVPRNMASKIAKGEYLFFLDDDAWVSKDVFSKLMKQYKSPSRAGETTRRM